MGGRCALLGDGGVIGVRCGVWYVGLGAEGNTWFFFSSGRAYVVDVASAMVSESEARPPFLADVCLRLLAGYF